MPQRLQRLRINSTPRGRRLHAGAINPPDAVIGHRQCVGTETLDPHRLPPNGPRLQRQSRAAAWRLHDIVGHRQFRAVKAREKLLTLGLVPGVFQENRLHRHRQRLRLLFQHGPHGRQHLPRLIAKRAPSSGGNHQRHPRGIAQIHMEVPCAFRRLRPGLSADHARPRRRFRAARRLGNSLAPARGRKNGTHDDKLQQDGCPS